MDSLWTAERSAWTRLRSPEAEEVTAVAVAEGMEAAAAEGMEAAADMEAAAAAVAQVEAEATAGTSLADMGTGGERARAAKLLSTRFQPAPSSTPNKEALCKKNNCSSSLFLVFLAICYSMLNLLACIFL